MQYKIRPSRFTGEWIVEAREEADDGEIYVVAFLGREQTNVWLNMSY